MRRSWVVCVVGALLAAAAIWGGAEARAPGLAELVYIGFLALFGGALAAGVRRSAPRREIAGRFRRGQR